MHSAWLLLATVVATLTGGDLTPLLADEGARTANPESSLLIRNATIVDGTGVAAYRGSVRVQGDRIVAVGELESGRDSEIVVDAAGLVLAPGFIDTHTHHVDVIDNGGDWHYLTDLPTADAAVSQGVTTSIIGVDGRSPLPFETPLNELEQTGTAVNVAGYVGHGSIRFAVMGDDYKRKATAGEIEQMRTLVAKAMAAGAIGVSSGLEYVPGVYSDTAELVALAQEAAKFGGRYMSHIRSEDRGIWAAIDEVVTIGREAGIPVQISHLKLGMRDLWGQSQRMIDVLDAARATGVDITADIYPYDFWETTLTFLFPDRDYQDLAAAQFALDHIVPAEGIRLVVYRPNPAYVGLTLAEIAEQNGTTAAQALLDLVVDVPVPEDLELATMAGISQADVDHLILWPHANICSDGSLVDSHPRGAGAFTKVLRYYVREKGLLSIEQAVHKMTALAAEHIGIADRGVVRAGAFADLVLLDPAIVSDRATVESPAKRSTGIIRVWVNGLEVFADGATTGNLPGRIIRREVSPSDP
jgi:N-acyl-D-amino-acid deacylase